MESIIIKQKEWNLKNFFKNNNDPEIEKKRKLWDAEAKKFITKWKNNEAYLKKPEVLKQALDDYENFSSKYGSGADEYYYFWLKKEQNQTDSEVKARYSKVEEFSKKIENDLQFFTLNISKIPKAEQNKFLTSPLLKEYNHFLKRLFDISNFLLSEKEEKILNLKSTPSYSLWKNTGLSVVQVMEMKIIAKTLLKFTSNYLVFKL